jgi:enoyl-CoA hydratase/carnithine racemase
VVNEMAENLSDFFQRFEASQFETYSETYKEFLKMTRRNGILEVQMHTDGGPLQFGWQVHSAWAHAWVDIGRDHENEVIILTGTGDRWLVGDPDIWKTPFIQWTADDKLKMRREAQKLLENLVFGIDVPMIAAINGPGTHCEIGTLCDITLVTEDVDFFDPHFLAGVPPGDGMALTLQRLMGIKRAAYYAYTGTKIDGKTAVELGIANEVVPREQLLPRARGLAAMMMERPRATRVMTHAILMRPWKQALVEDQLSHGASQSFALCCDEEGVWARLDKMRHRF